MLDDLRPMRRRSWPIVIACVAVAPIAAALALLVGHDVRRAEAARPLFARDQDYVGASACRACHPDRYASWRRTYHASMTQLPDERTVRGRFDGQPVTLFGATATPYQRDGRFFFQLPPVGGEGPRDAEVALCVGSRRYQQYFERTDGPDGTIYRRLPLLWHIGEARWLHINGVFLEPDERRLVAAGQAVWNVNCVFCHNTGIAPGLKPVGDSGDKRFDTHVADVGIACESCHGPGRDHVALYASPLARYRTELASAAARAVVDPLRVGQAESAALCGQCHAQRLPDPMEKLWTFLDTGPTFRPGGLLAGHVKPLSRDLPVPPPGDARHVPAALLERRDRAPDRVRIRGAHAVALLSRRAIFLHELPHHARGRRRRTDRARSARRPRVHAVPRGDRARRRRAHAPRAGVQRLALRGVPHAPHRLRRARDPPQPPRRGARRRARRRGRPPQRLHALPHRPRRRVGRRSHARLLGRALPPPGRAPRRRAAGRARGAGVGARGRSAAARGLRDRARPRRQRGAGERARVHARQRAGRARRRVRRRAVPRAPLGAGAGSRRSASASATISPPTTSRRRAPCAIRRCRRCCSGSPPRRTRACRRRPTARS